MVGEVYTIECVGMGGVPTPALAAIVGVNEEVTEEDFSLDPIEEHSDGMVGGTVSKLFKFEPTKDHRFLSNWVIYFETDREIHAVE